MGDHRPGRPGTSRTTTYLREGTPQKNHISSDLTAHQRARVNILRVSIISRKRIRPGTSTSVIYIGRGAACPPGRGQHTKPEIRIVPPLHEEKIPEEFAPENSPKRTGRTCRPHRGQGRGPEEAADQAGRDVPGPPTPYENRGAAKTGKK